MRQIKHFNAGGDEIRWCGRLEVWHIQTRHVSLIRLLCHSSSLLSEGTQRCFWGVVHEWVVVTILGEHKILLYRLTLRPYRGEPYVRRGRQRTPLLRTVGHSGRKSTPIVITPRLNVLILPPGGGHNTRPRFRCTDSP